QTLALIDSKTVEPITYGMSDADFIAWAQKPQTFNVTGQPNQQTQQIPAEWNYYGAMDSQTLNVAVTGVALPAGAPPVSGLAGAALSFSGGITDVNSEGSPPATQFFMDSLKLASGSQVFIQGIPSKGVAQGLNFYRNVNLQADGGAGGYVYQVIMKGAGTTINIPGFEGSDVVGVVLRYYLYRPLPGLSSLADIEALYQKQGTNPVVIGIAGTFAPLYAKERILTSPVGRMMVQNTANIPTPGLSNNSGPAEMVALAPGFLRQSGNRISADLIATFPENYQGNPNAPDPKFDCGDISLAVTDGTTTATIGQVNYLDVNAGNSQGWIYDFDISCNQGALTILQNPDATFALISPKYGTVLAETDYFFVTNQMAIYTEQHGSGTQFLNQGTTEPVSVAVFHRGKELSASACPPITVWQYRSIPLQAPGNALAISTNLKPGQPITVDTSQPGNFLFVFSIDAPAGFPPESYSTFMNPPYITNVPSITLRILPNGEDFSQYYVDPSVEEPTGNALLTFDVVYRKVLRTYYLLYPAMNQVFPLNSEKAVTAMAKGILQRTEMSLWMTTGYMPRTRDMSASRRTLLRAWCRKVAA
ncbi:MAG TPA: hypothetical protein VGM43_01015, partial [Bryobacteraceae bacterium]